MSTKIVLDKKYTIRNIDEYEKGWVRSRETVTVIEGDVRVIRDVLMKALMVQESLQCLFSDRRDTVWWVPASGALNTRSRFEAFVKHNVI